MTSCVAVDAHAVDSVADLQERLYTVAPGTTVQLDVDAAPARTRDVTVTSGRVTGRLRPGRHRDRWCGPAGDRRLRCQGWHSPARARAATSWSRSSVTCSSSWAARPPGGARIDLARTLAQGVASGGEPERNVDPADRMKFEELAHVAELHVAELTGLPITATGATIEIAAVAPGAWAWQTVEDWRFLLEAMAEPRRPPDAAEHRRRGHARPGRQDRRRPKGTLGYVDTSRGLDRSTTSTSRTLDAAASTPTSSRLRQGPADLLARWMATMGPMLAAMQLGSAVGHLARSTMGAYELPIPRHAAAPARGARQRHAGSPRTGASTPDEVRLWVCLRELTAHAVLSRPHVADRLRELLVRVVPGMAEDTAGLVDNLQGIDLTQPDVAPEPARRPRRR